MSDDKLRRAAVVAAPVLVPASMAALFRFLSRRLPPRHAYNIGFLVYWFGWCTAFPIWAIGPKAAARLLMSGRRPESSETALLLLPVAGAVSSELIPNRKGVTGPVAAVMIGTGVVNAVAEELLWRGLFVHEFPKDPLRGAAWPLVGFSIWHLAPQIVLPSPIGRWKFVLGAAFVGSASTLSNWRNEGLRNCLLPHIATDACGVTAARFRLAMGD